MNAPVPYCLKQPDAIRKEESTISPLFLVKRTISDLDLSISKPPFKRQKRKCVCFAEAANRLHNIEATEANDCWLQDEDYNTIHRDTRDTLKEIIMLRGRVSLMNEDRFCARGLEGSIAKILGNNNYHMSSKFQSVLLRKQASDVKKYGFVDPVSLSHISILHSKHDRLRASRLAQFDAKLS
jgi:hypothetical protein